MPHQPPSPRRVHAWLAIVVIAAMLLASPLVAAQDATPGADPVTTETQAPATEVATEPPTETPTELATEVATEEAPATEVATEAPAARGAFTTSMDAEPESPSIPPNTDALVATGATDPVTLDPGQQQPITFTYAVTTPRLSTSIHAELRHADGTIASGWELSVQAGDAEARGGEAVELVVTGSLTPDTSFPLAIIVTAPAEVDADQTVSLWISSTASTERGETEIGVEAAAPLASLTVVPPPAEPNTLACDVPEVTEVEPEGTAELPCAYIVNDPAAEASVSAVFDGVPGDGWLIAINDGPAGGTATWAPAEALPEGTTVELIVRVTAPTDAEAGQQATIAAGESEAAAAWTITVARPEDDIVATQGGFTLNAVSGKYTVHVQDRGGTPIDGVCYTVKFTTELDLGLIGSALNTLGLMGTVNGLVNALDTRGPIDGCGTGSNSPTGVLTTLVNDLSALELTVLGVPILSLDSLLRAVIITPEITPPSTNPGGYANPEVADSGSFTLLTYRNSGVESWIIYESLTACNPTARINGTLGLVFDDSTWQGSSWESVGGSIQIGFEAAPSGTSCDGSFPTNWFVHISTSSMGQTDGDESGIIPVGSITYTGGSGVTGLDARADSQAAANATIATGTSEYNGGNLTANFTLAPPDTSPPGSYEGTITITTSASSN